MRGFGTVPQFQHMRDESPAWLEMPDCCFHGHAYLDMWNEYIDLLIWNHLAEVIAAAAMIYCAAIRRFSTVYLEHQHVVLAPRIMVVPDIHFDPAIAKPKLGSLSHYPGAIAPPGNHGFACLNHRVN